MRSTERSRKEAVLGALARSEIIEMTSAPQKISRNIPHRMQQSRGLHLCSLPFLPDGPRDSKPVLFTRVRGPQTAYRLRSLLGRFSPWVLTTKCHKRVPQIKLSTEVTAKIQALQLVSKAREGALHPFLCLLGLTCPKSRLPSPN